VFATFAAIRPWDRTSEFGLNGFRKGLAIKRVPFGDQRDIILVGVNPPEVQFTDNASGERVVGCNRS
jgi:hypothetical protein